MSVFTGFAETFIEFGGGVTTTLTHWADIGLSITQVIVLMVNVLCVCKLDTDMLCVFAVYDEKRILKWVSYLRGILVLYFTATGMPGIILNIMYTINANPQVYFLLMVFGSFCCGFAVLFDNATCFYLAFLVYKNSKSKNVARKRGLFRSSLGLLIAGFLMDWGMVAVTIYTIASDEHWQYTDTLTSTIITSPVQLSIFIINLSASFSGIHVAGIAILLINLAHLALDHVLEKRRGKEERLKAQNVHEPPKSPVAICNVAISPTPVVVVVAASTSRQCPHVQANPEGEKDTKIMDAALYESDTVLM